MRFKRSVYKLAGKTIAFLIALCCLAGFVCWLRFDRHRNQTFKFDEGIRVLFIGNSHIETSINDSLLPGCINVARSADLIEITYSKIRLFVDANPSVRTVVMGMDHSTIFSDPLELDVVRWVPEYPLRYSPKDWYYLLTKRPTDYFYHMATRFMNEDCAIERKYRFMNGYYSWTGYNGGYMYLTESALKESKERIETGTFSESFDERLPTKSERWFLDKIKRYLDQKGVRLIFLAPPVHQYVLDRTGLWRKWVKENYPDIPLIDGSAFELPDSCFKDHTHVNHYGAEIFTSSLIIEGDSVRLLPRI